MNTYVAAQRCVSRAPGKAAAWKEQVVRIIKETGKGKVNVIGHSDGCPYSRYAISRLGLHAVAASHTGPACPHRGSCIADMLMGLTALATPGYDPVRHFLHIAADPKDKRALMRLSGFTCLSFRNGCPGTSLMSP